MESDPKPSEAAVRACHMLRQAERLLAASGFYAEANAIREQRGMVEKCSVDSVDNLKPDFGAYTLSTIGELVDGQKERA